MFCCLTLIAAVVAILVTPGQVQAARACPAYVDFFAVRAFDGASCATVRGVQRALYRRGFDAGSGW